MRQDQLNELVLQSWEHTKGCIEVYEAALECVVNNDLRERWQLYLQETRQGESVLRQTCKAIGVDTNRQTPGRGVVKLLVNALVWAMRKARAEAKSEMAELVACECVVLAETKDSLNWELIGSCADRLTNGLPGDHAKALQAAQRESTHEVDDHLRNAKLWRHELWLASLGMDSDLPPAKERRNTITLRATWGDQISGASRQASVAAPR